MNRRGFLGRVIGAVAAAKVAPKLVETPAVTVGYVSAHDTLTGAPLTAPMTITTTGNAGTYHFIDTYGSQWTAPYGVRVGDVVHVSLPKRFTERDGSITIEMT